MKFCNKEHVGKAIKQATFSYHTWQQADQQTHKANTESLPRTYKSFHVYAKPQIIIWSCLDSANPSLCKYESHTAAASNFATTIYSSHLVDFFCLLWNIHFSPQHQQIMVFFVIFGHCSGYFQLSVSFDKSSPRRRCRWCFFSESVEQNNFAERVFAYIRDIFSSLSKNKLLSFQVFVFLLSILVTMQQALSSGYLNSAITTIEKRYEIPSSISGIIASMYEIGNVITVIFVSYLGSRRHIPIFIGVGEWCTKPVLAPSASSVGVWKLGLLLLYIWFIAFHPRCSGSSWQLLCRAEYK